MRGKIVTAIVDGGISDSDILRGKVDSKIQFLTEDVKKRSISNRQLASVHGTTCAEIISEICPDTHFLDLMVMQQDGTTKISKLLEALDWCLNHEIKLIHLSLGTVNYFDIKLLEESVRRLLEKNIILVAAYNNYNIRTYPAAFPGVFGVRQDREGILDQKQFLFQNQTGYGNENSIVAHWWGPDGKQRANSYAAPVITGHIARALCENKNAEFPDVLKFLENNAVMDKEYPHNIENVIYRCENLNGKDRNRMEKKESVNIPVIAGERVCRRTMQMLVKAFENKGFEALLLQEGSTDTGELPFEYYGGRNVPLRHILYTVDQIYEPDIIFLNFLSEIAEAEKSEIDMLISKDRNTYSITAEGLLKTVSKPIEILDIICRYF